MLSTAEARELIDDLFEEEALLLGGLIALHDVDDDLVWRLVRSLDAIRRKALRRLAADAGPQTPLPHPAIEQFLETVRAT